MGISHIFRIDDRYTSIDQWSIIWDKTARCFSKWRKKQGI